MTHSDERPLCSRPDCEGITPVGSTWCPVHWTAIDSGSFQQHLKAAFDGRGNVNSGEMMSATRVSANAHEFEAWLGSISNVAPGRVTARIERPSVIDNETLTVPLWAKVDVELTDIEHDLNVRRQPGKSGADRPSSAVIRGLAGRLIAVTGDVDLDLIDVPSCRLEATRTTGTMSALFSKESNRDSLFRLRDNTLPAAARATTDIPEARLELDAGDAHVAELEIVRGRWRTIRLSPYPSKLLSIRDATLPSTFAVIDRTIDVVLLERVTGDDVELTDLVSEHVWIRRSKIKDFHGRGVSARTYWVNSCEIAEHCSIRRVARGTLALTKSKVDGLTTLESSGASEISVGASQFSEEAPLSVRAGSKPCVVSLDHTTTKGLAVLGDARRPVIPRASGWSALEAVVIHATETGQNDTVLHDITALKPWTITAYPPVAAAPTRVEFSLRDSRFAEVVRIEGSSAKSGAAHESVAFEGSVTFDELHLSYLDLSDVSFIAVPVDQVRLGPSNTFDKMGTTRRRLFDEIAAKPGDLQRLGNTYRAFRTNLEDTSASTLANDFYVGELLARRATETTPNFEKVVIWLYGTLGGWGVRPLRPALALTLLATLMCVVAFSGGLPTPKEEDARRIAVTLEALLPWSRIINRDAADFSAVMQLLLTPARVLAVIFTGFVAIGLRSQVRR